jgi:signal transduction histidine kinase
VVLSFPDGLLKSRFDWIVVVLYAFVIGPVEILWLMFWEPAWSPGNVLAFWPNEGVADAIDKFQRFWIVLATAALAVSVARRWVVASGPTRRLLLPILPAVAALILGGTTTALDTFDIVVPSIRWLLLAAYASVPVAVIAVVARAHLARTSVADLIVSLHSNTDPTDLRVPLARALGDPQLRLGYWMAKTHSYVDGEGQALDLRIGEPGLAVRFIDRAGQRVAALTYDASLDDNPDLIDAVIAAAGIALENGQLHAELKARLDELTESRARVIEAGQAERKRLERNLHDGTQQRLVALSMELSTLERRLDQDAEARARIRHARDEIAASLDELRDVARGLYPSVLSLRGLPMALKSLAATSKVPVHLDVDVAARLDESVEVTVYYVVSESLANVGKHAQASAVSVRVVRAGSALDVTVADDGIGGADDHRGSGLQGLADRVEASGGQFRVTTAPGHGTRVWATIPCR